MSYAAHVLADSIASGVRLTTLEVTFPRFILAEFNTHRVFSRNSASSRAIPVEKRIKQVLESPFIPETFTVNKRGMQADGVLDDRDGSKARHAWLCARDAAVEQANRLVDLGVHKQHANRLLEPYCWHTVVVTSTRWENFFNLRCHPAAQPEMQITAKLMRDVMNAHEPRALEFGQWHLPFIEPDEALEEPVTAYFLDEVEPRHGTGYTALTIEQQLALSVTRCAAVSFERQNSPRALEQAQQRHDDMRRLGHWSPFEHQARVGLRGVGVRSLSGNLDPPWCQYRKTFDGEDVFQGT